jgi:hypothetical protein
MIFTLLGLVKEKIKHGMISVRFSKNGLYEKKKNRLTIYYLYDNILMTQVI